MYFLYSLAKIMFLRGGHALKSLFFAKQFMNIYLEIIQASITFAPKFKKRYEPVLNYNIQYAQCCMGQQDLMRPFHSARTLVQRIHLTTLQFTFYYFALPLPRKGRGNAAYGVSVRRNRTNLCIHPKKKKTYVYNYIYHVYRNRYRIPDA